MDINSGDDRKQNLENKMDHTQHSGHGVSQHNDADFLTSTISKESHETQGDVAEDSRSSVGIVYMNVLVSIAESLLFGGIQFGWSSLVFVYKEIGVYGNLCPGNQTRDQSESCPQQEEYLNMFFSIATALLFIISIVVGFIHHRLGTTKCRLLFIGIYSCGMLLLSFTTSDIPWLFLPGLTLVGVSGLALLVTDLEVVSYIRKGKAFFVTVLNGAFDSSAVVMVIVKIFYERGIKIQHTFWGILAVYLLVTLSNTFLHWKQSQLIPGSTSSEKTEDEEGNDEFEDEKQTNGKGFVNRQLSMVLESDEMVSDYTNVLSYSLFGGVLVSIIVGSLLECIKKRFEGRSDVYKKDVYPVVIALSACCTMSLMISILEIFQSADTFYAEFVVIPFYRSLLFSTNMNYVVTMFHNTWVSHIVVISFALMGVATISQYFLFKWVVENNVFQQMNYMMLGLTMASFALPVMLLLNRKRDASKNASKVLL
ncbi:equilibrative nucleobase transporter 1-like isoform X3 [Ostrea edulis]|uniref:equilibrative nucleobase transporter 1-like isoform X3 n=1 Tax=Ostrea edulis TaxID=37623 RepID=UPI0024AFFCB0|nr:equilibrative nucleobase transporter 1-like isoform X3 [Ostrea edulis]XP_056007764.1 equilibrative nucleobase transporter 1-like isoform X3 [Ostrea edulis]